MGYYFLNLSQCALFAKIIFIFFSFFAIDLSGYYYN